MSYLNDLQEMKDALQPFSEPFEKMQILNDEQIETIYAAAFGLYETGDYEKAAGLFTRLILHDPFKARFWKGLASSRQLMRDYEAALRAWSLVGYLEMEKHEPHFHAAECFISMGNKEDALKALNFAKDRLKPEDPRFEKIQFLKMRIENDKSS